jgi:hypothetical protein
MPIKLQLRMPDDLHAALRDQSEANGRSLNAELLDRLERSCGQAGEDAERLGRAVAIAAQAVGETASAHVPGKPAWPDNPWTYGQVCFAIMKLLPCLAPDGPIVKPEPSPTLIAELIEGGSSPEQARLVAEGVVDRGPSIHMINYLTSQGTSSFYAGAHAFQNAIGPKWAGRLRK